MIEAKSLSKAIENLSSKRHVISDEAVAAKKHFDEEKEASPHDQSAKKISNKQIALIEEFHHSVKLLSLIFQKSKFDELVLFISNSNRVLVINLLIGFVRGIGWFVGFALMLLMFLMFLKEFISPNLLQEIKILLTPLT
jgi:hypothetical protein